MINQTQNQNPTNQPSIRVLFSEVSISIAIGEPFDPIVDYINNARQLAVNAEALMERGVRIGGLI